MVCNVILDEIRSGIYPPGYYLPSFRNLAQHFGVSVNTIQTALDVLQKEKWVTIKRGVGVFAAKRPGSAKSNRKIGVIMRDPFDPAQTSDPMARLYQSLCSGIQKAGYQAKLLKPSDRRLYYYENIFANDVAESKVDGLVTVGVMRPDYLHQLKQTRIPLVCVDSDGTALGLDCVLNDDLLSATRLTRHLIALGHRRIAYFSRPLPGGRRIREHDPSTFAREDGIRIALDEHKLPFLPEWTFYQPVKDRAWPEYLGRFLQEQNPTAMILFSEGYLDSFQKAVPGLAIPETLSLAGFGWHKKVTSSKKKHQLTRVQFSQSEVGRQASRLILRRIANPTAQMERCLVEGTLFEGSTTGAPRQERLIRIGEVSEVII